jgi:hypothetical protein
MSYYVTEIIQSPYNFLYEKTVAHGYGIQVLEKQATLEMEHIYT